MDQFKNGKLLGKATTRTVVDEIELDGTIDSLLDAIDNQPGGVLCPVSMEVFADGTACVILERMPS